jgi:hypothetical protein
VLGTGESIDWLLHELIGVDSWALTNNQRTDFNARPAIFSDREGVASRLPSPLADESHAQSADSFDQPTKVDLLILRRSIHHAQSPPNMYTTLCGIYLSGIDYFTST